MSHNKEHQVQKVFLITSAMPSHNGIGSIFIRDVLNAAPDVDVHWRVVPAFMLSRLSARTGLVWRAANALLARLGVLNDIRLAVFRSWKQKALADALAREFHASGASTIWLTTSNPELIFLAENLAQRGLDIRVTVWDAPEYLIQNLRLSKRSADRILARFSSLLRNARACSVVSDGMKTEYARQAPNLPIVFMRHGIAPHPATSVSQQPGAVRIVFAGSLYSKQEWNAFVRALDSVAWRVAGRDIRLDFVGSFPLKDAQRPKAVTLHPPMSQDEVLSFMAQADIGYLPYWLDPSKEFVARTSFPGKMTAYSAAGLAIFHHAPASSSVTSFLADYPYGVACSSLQTPTILEALDTLITMMGAPSVHDARRLAMEQQLSDTAMIRGFRTLIAAPPIPSKHVP